ncbi:MAG: tail fiber protein [Leptolyngbyaceae cyanobacterium MO_188.B28]|nr:tail fiber protein [Leptolyngbyaceae cyanobacterium MO_188.B28]
MSDPFLGEIRMFAGNFAPRSWSFCNGQLLATSQNDALFSLLGTIYGGDGRTTFGLPDLRGRLPIHQGTGAGLSSRRIGSRGGAETETLAINQMPSHTHILQGSDNNASSDNPSGAVLAKRTVDFYKKNPDQSKVIDFPSTVVESTGGGQPHSNMQPYLGINFIICLAGIYPSRS